VRDGGARSRGRHEEVPLRCKCVMHILVVLPLPIILAVV
jgi:hypothetical protein